ncbi:hypothetical protein KR059_009743, partial [Drosophila kikkawai]
VEADSLGSPVGVVCSNATMTSAMQEAEATARYFATYLKAFALIYVLPEVDWTAENMDMLLEQGMDLYRCSSETNKPDDDDQPGNQLLEPGVYTNEEKRIKRNFKLEGHTFTMAVEPRYLGEATRPHTIKNLKRVLQAFFKSSRYCLLLTRVGHLLVWRRRKSFFVLDVKGRRRDDLRGDKDNGVAMLVCLKTIDSVVYLASNLSDITPKDVFTIRELVVVRLKTPDGRIYMRDSSYRSVEFKVVNKSYAYLKATLHLSLNQNGTVKNRSSLMVAVGSILASKIDHPANWDTHMLDRLICYGVDLCFSSWSDCLRERRPIDLDTFPTQLRIGQFVVALQLIPGVRLGHWECDLDVVSTDFEANCTDALEGFGNLVFQINSQIYAMWSKNDFYYLLDPYRHTIVGTHVEEDQYEGAKWATLRMFRDRLTMLSVFHNLLQETNRQSAYSVHAVRINYITECPQGFVPSPLPEEVDTCDVESLNEPILFSDQLGATVQDHRLAEISSDCEDEKEDDLKKFQVLEPRQCAGAAENRVLEASTRSQPSPSKKPIFPTPEATKSNTRSLKTSKKIAPTTVARKPKVTFKEAKHSGASFQDSGNTTQRNSSRIPVKFSRMPAENYKTEFKREAGGARVLDDSTAISKAASNADKDLKAKWSAKESAIIRLGSKVAATNLITSRDVSIKASSPSILPSKGHPNPQDALKTKSETVPPQTTISKQSMAPVTNKHFPTSVSSETGRRAEQAPFQKQKTLNNEELHNASKRSGSLTRFPGYHREPQLLAVAGSESGTVESLNRLLGSAFKVANRVLTMTPWGNYVVFQHSPDSAQGSVSSSFFLFDGCTCNIDRFRHLDLSTGTAGLVAFRKLSEVICHMIDSREKKALKKLQSR